MISRKSSVIGLCSALLFMISGVFTTETYAQRGWWQKLRKQDPPEKISTLEHAEGHQLEIIFEPGRRHNHPLMAFWIEDTSGIYIQSLFVAQSIAEGYFRHGDASSGRWQPGPLRRPAALPYWGHKRGVKAPDGFYLPTREDPMPDAVTGATPKAAFVLHSSTRHREPRVFNILMEINQSWDWNQHWHNNKYPEDLHYKTSSQPALVYKVTVDLNNLQDEYIMQPIGHSHWSGASGELFNDLSTLTTALDIAREIKVRVTPANEKIH